MAALGSHLKTLEVNHLSWETFGVEHNIAQVAKSFPNITELCLDIFVRIGRGDVAEDHPTECRETMKNGVLRGFIGALGRLTDLTVRFTHKSTEYVTAVNLADVLPFDRLGLQYLRLERFETPEEHITKPLQSNAATMQGLALADIFLSPRGSWENIFRVVRCHMDIKSARFHGVLCDSVQPGLGPDRWNHMARLEDGWNFNWYSDEEEDEGGEELERRLTKHLVEGGEYPLSKERKGLLYYGARRGSLRKTLPHICITYNTTGGRRLFTSKKLCA